MRCGWSVAVPSVAETEEQVHRLRASVVQLNALLFALKQ